MSWLPCPKNINIPVSFHVYKTAQNRIVFLFGDNHETNADQLYQGCKNDHVCMNLDFWIRELVERAPERVDVFIEDSMEWVVDYENLTKLTPKEKRCNQTGQKVEELEGVVEG